MHSLRLIQFGTFIHNLYRNVLCVCSKSLSSFQRNFKIRKMFLTLNSCEILFHVSTQKNNSVSRESAIDVCRIVYSEKLVVTHMQQRAMGNNCRCRVIHAPHVINGCYTTMQSADK